MLPSKVRDWKTKAPVVITHRSASAARLVAVLQAPFLGENASCRVASRHANKGGGVPGFSTARLASVSSSVMSRMRSVTIIDRATT